MVNMRDINKGNYLKELRIKNNLTQKDLGDLVHYSDKNISKWEQGKSFPQDDKTLSDLATALGVTKKDLQNCGKKPIIESKFFKFGILGAIIITVIIVIITLLTKTKVYIIRADSKDVYIENGNYIVSHNYVNFSINYIDTNDSNEIESIELYKYISDKPVLLHRTNSFPIDIYKRKSEKSSFKDLDRHTTVLKIKYKNNSEMDIKLEFKDAKSDFDNEEKKEEKSIELYSEPKSVEEYLSQIGFTIDSNSYIKKINENIKISYNSPKSLNLDIETDGFKISYKLYLEIDKLAVTKVNTKTWKIKDKNLKISNYKILDCDSNSCNKEDDYVGYLIYLKSRIKSIKK